MGLDERTAAALDEELRREMRRRHPLYGRTCIAIAKREANDDVLFALGEDEVAVVHLTWAGKQERPPWPTTTFYASFVAFLADIAHDDSP
jgi:hypothetical protein